MGKLNANKGNETVESKHGYYAYPDGKIFWGINIYRKGSIGIEVEKGFDGDIAELFKKKKEEA